MEFHILGPLEVVHDGRALELGGRRQRAVLALLLLRAGEVISSDRLIEELWGGHPPATAANTLQAYVSRLRKALGTDGVLVSHPPGYVLKAAADSVDLHRFNALVERGREALAGKDAERASQLLSRALELWRGPPLFDFLYEPFAQADVSRLEDLRLDALELRLDADLALGRHARLIGELESLVGLHPFREGFRAQHMLALYRSGRQAEALEAYRSARATMVEELGIEPGPELQRLERAILEHDPELAPAPATPASEATQTATHPGAMASRQSRKTVTVVFIDVAYSTDLGRGLDPEVLAEAMGRYSDLVRSVVERHGGQVFPMSAGSTMAVFGAPLLHEDDALRAVRAAHELRAELELLKCELEQRLTLEARMGIDTGKVLTGVGDAGDSIVGDSIQVASRLQRLASPGDILLGGATHRLIRDWATAEDLGSRELEGSGAPVRVWRLTAIARTPEPRALDLRSRLVARKREMTLLRQTFERVQLDRACHLVTLIGPPGIGKSRLVRDLLEEIGGRARILRGRCLSYGSGITFWPAAEIVREAAGIQEGDTSERAVEALAGVLGGGDGRALAQRIAGLVGLTADPIPASENFWAVRRFLQTLADDKPVVVVVDDIQWAQPTLLDLLEHIVDWSHGSPILLVCMARHDLLEIRPGWSGGKINAASLLLEPLTDGESAELIDNLLGSAEIAPEAQDSIVRTAGGNPLFIEEVLRTLIEDRVLEHWKTRWVISGDIAAAPPPPTVEALLGARLDRLGGSERAVIEGAAVIGEAFEPALLAALCAEEIDVERELSTLALRELIRPGAAPEPGGAFRFRHVLIREAAYRSIPRRERAELHKRLADRLEKHPEELRIDRDEVLGYHLEQASAYGQERYSPATIAQLSERATLWLTAAGRRALARGDHAAAAGLLTRVLALPRIDRTAHGDVVLDLGLALVELGELGRADTLFGEAIYIGKATGARAIEWRARAERSVWRMSSSQASTTEVARRAIDGAINELTALGDDHGLAEVWRLLSDVHNIAGHEQARAQALVRALEHARRAGDPREEARIRHWLSSAMLHGPAPLSAVLLRIEEDLHWAREVGDRGLEGSSLSRLGMARTLSGQFGQARRALVRASAICEELGLVIPLLGVAQTAGFLELRAGEPTRAEQELRVGLEACNAIGEHSYLSTVAGLLAHALIEQGRYEAGLEFATVADQATASDDLASQILSRTARARVLAHRHDLDGAVALAREAATLGDSTDLLVMQADAYAELGALLALAGLADEAAEAVAEASRRFDAKGVALSARRMTG